MSVTGDKNQISRINLKKLTLFNLLNLKTPFSYLQILTIWLNFCGNLLPKSGTYLVNKGSNWTYLPSVCKGFGLESDNSDQKEKG